MTYQGLRDILLCSFKTGLKRGARGQQVRDFQEIKKLIKETSIECIKEYLFMHNQIMSFGPEITTRATGKKGLVLDYHIDNSGRKGTRFGALWIVPQKNLLHIYFHGLKDKKKWPKEISMNHENSSGVPHTWIPPNPDLSKIVLKLLEESFQNVSKRMG